MSDVFDEDFLATLGRLRLALRRVRAADASGARRTGRRGSGLEFAEHRSYSEGDELRHVDWQAYARTGRMFVKRFEQEDEPRVLCVIDASASMATGGKLRTAQQLAYALAHLALEDGARVRMAVARDGDLRLSSVVSATQRAGDLAAFLARVDPGGTTDLDASLAKLPPAAPGTRVVFVLTDLFAERDGRVAAGAGAARGDEICVLHLHAQVDREFPVDRPVVLVDAETGDRLRLDAAEAARRAADHGARVEETWRALAARHRVAYVPVDAAWSLEEIVLHRLRAAGVVA